MTTISDLFDIPNYGADATTNNDVDLDDSAPTLSDFLELNQDDREFESRSLTV